MSGLTGISLLLKAVACKAPLVPTPITDRLGRRRTVCEYPQGQEKRFEKHPSKMTDKELWGLLVTLRNKKETAETRQYLDAAMKEYRTRQKKRGLRKAWDRITGFFKARARKQGVWLQPSGRLAHRKDGKIVPYVPERGEPNKAASLIGVLKLLRKL